MRVDTVLAPNPSFFTGPGTNSYIIGSRDEVVVIDPGPIIEQHRQAILACVAGRRAVAVVVTHTHPDHAPLSNPLAVALDAPVLGFEPGPDFSPDRTIADLDTVGVGGLTLTAIHTPGHTADHLCYLVDRVLFTGDHIMGGSTVMIEDAGAYMQSLERIAGLGPQHLYPGHGPELPEATTTIEEYIAHRRMRERQVVDAVAAGALTIDDIVDMVYTEVPTQWRMAAAMQVRTQLIKLISDHRLRWATAEGEAGGVRLAED